MSFLHENESEHIAARITNEGRQKIAEGNFNIEYFQIGDSEFDYEFDMFNGITGTTNPSQKVFTPLDKDSIVKYPYKVSQSTVTGTNFGTPVQVSQIETIRNEMGAAGFVSKYIEYDDVLCTGSTIECTHTQVPISAISGTTTLYITGGTFSDCEFITIAFTQLIGADAVISGSSSSLIYKVTNFQSGTTVSTLTLDRNMPNMASICSGGFATVICNKCNPFFTGPYDVDLTCLPNTQNPEDQQDPWTLNVVWSTEPAGMDVYAGAPDDRDEELSGYTGNLFVSTKEFLGYNSSSGQTTNTGTTITNTFGDVIIVTPEEQHSLAILHYAELNSEREPEKFFKYEDYISTNNSTVDALLYDVDDEPITDLQYFEIYIPFLYYERNTGSTIGARFFMGDTDYYINSTAMDTKLNKIKYRYLIDEQNVKVGKIFYNHKIIVFDDQEIVATLDYKSNRKYTLPIPRVAQVPVDTKCGVDGNPLEPLMSGTTGQTVFVTYMFENTLDLALNGLHCNHYSKITGTTLNADISLKFSDSSFQFMRTTNCGNKTGYTANKMYALVQLVDTGDQPQPNLWRKIDITSDIPGHTVGTLINPTNLRGTRFVITNDDYENATLYDLETYLGNFPDNPIGSGAYEMTTPQFGDEQPFPGSIKLVRASDLAVMRFLVNLPSGTFDTTQNPSYTTGKQKKITEVALLNENKDVLVIGKMPKPINRTGTQVFAVKIDL
jgi:hypothetical protein